MNPRKLYTAGLKLFFVAVIFLIQLGYIFLTAQKMNGRKAEAQSALNELVTEIDNNIQKTVQIDPQKVIDNKKVTPPSNGIKPKMKNLEQVMSLTGAQFSDLLIILGITFLLQILLIGSAGFSLMGAAKK